MTKVILKVILNMKEEIAQTIVVWDDNKNRINYSKHGISFETAALAFADPQRIEYFDEVHSIDEDRYVVLGLVNNVLFVVYTMRDEKVRLISARLANSMERRIYYGK